MHPAFSENALAILRERYLRRDDAGDIVETPYQKRHAVHTQDQPPRHGPGPNFLHASKRLGRTAGSARYNAKHLRKHS